MTEPTSGPLAGLRVLDASTVLAGPFACQVLGDYGAEVIKIEHPTRGDNLRGHGSQKDGQGLWWKMVGRNKRCLGLYLGDPAGAAIFAELAATADVIVENFRPGTFERWGLDYESLSAQNPGLVLCRITGFGQDGPYASRPAFGTLIEAMSGFAHMTGPADGPPTLPPFGLADSVAGLSAVSAIMMALHHRSQTGTGQIIDQSILEPLTTMMGPHIVNYDQTGAIAKRSGNRSSNNAPRNTYLTADQKWVAVSSSADAVARRTMVLVERPGLADEPWFASGSGRAAHSEIIDEAVSSWIGARDFDDVVAAFEKADVALAPIYDVEAYLGDPQVQFRRAVVTVDDERLGPIRMQNMLFDMSETPGEVRFAGRDLGADTDSILTELGLDADRIDQLRNVGVIA